MKTDTEIELWDDASDFEDDAPSGQAWKILVVDDDPDVHRATAYSLKDVRIFDRQLDLIFASTVEEALARSAETDDISVAVIDVVMETADAGLNLVKALRKRDLYDTRLILRTGFPGYAPELSVVTDYEIDGYFTKEELTRTRLISLLTTAIRAYDNIRLMSRSREGLELIVGSARQLFKRNDLEMFAEGVLTQVAALLRVSTSGLVSGCNAGDRDMRIITGIGRFAGQQGRKLAEVDSHLQSMSLSNAKIDEPFHQGDYLGMRFETDFGALLFAALESDRVVKQPELDLLRLFSSNISVGFENLSLIEALNRRAYTDTLLDLPNLNAFEEALKTAFEKGRGGHIAQVHVCDYQSHIATFGTIVARKLMQAAYKRLRALAGDDCEVAVVAEGTFGIVDREGKLTPKKLSDALSGTYVIDNISLAPSSTSIILPIADLPDDTVHAFTVATAALVHIKSLKDGAHVIYGKSERNAWERRNTLQNALKVSSDTFDGLASYLQPKVDMITGEVVGAEALLRWNHNGEAVSPAEFIPIAEASGLTQSLTAFVLREVAQWSHANANGHPIPVAVNLSMADLNVPGFAHWLLEQLAALGLEPQHIEFEVTEAIAMSGKVAIQQAQELARKGYNISLDDFGTGYSSLAHLEQLPFQTVKIDRSFVSHLTAEKAPKSLCSAIIAMTELLHLSCIAEGIETEEQRDVVCRMGCRYGQGFLFGRPMPMADFATTFKLGTVAAARSNAGRSDNGLAN